MPHRSTHEKESKGGGITYDRSLDRCRDEQGHFVECPPEIQEKGRSSAGGRGKEGGSEKGGESRSGGRSLASAEKETRERVAKKGGEASHGGRGSSRSSKK
jgi:hypothetical protein